MIVALFGDLTRCCTRPRSSLRSDRASWAARVVSQASVHGDLTARIKRGTRWPCYRLDRWTSRSSD